MKPERLQGNIVDLLNQKAVDLSEKNDALAVAQDEAKDLLESMEVSDDLMELAAVIDLTAVHEGKGQPGFAQRLVRNMSTTLTPDAPYCIFEDGDIPKLVNGAILDRQFLRPHISRNQASIVYYEKPIQGEGNGLGVFSAIADTSEDISGCGDTDLLTAFFGDESFSATSDDSEIKATSLDGRQLLTTDRGHVLSLFGRNIAAVTGEDAAPQAFEQTEANLRVLERLEFDDAAAREVVDELTPEERSQLVKNVVQFLVEKEKEFRYGGSGSCSVEHAYLGDKLPGIKNFPKTISLFSEDIKSMVLEEAGQRQGSDTILARRRRARKRL